MLAVTLGHKKCAQILLNHKASVNVTDSTGFNGELNDKRRIFRLFPHSFVLVLHEAVTTADPEFIRDVYEQKEVQRYSSRVDGIPNLLSKICDVSIMINFLWIKIKYYFSQTDYRFLPGNEMGVYQLG